MQYYFRYILGRVVAPLPVMLIGTATHNGVEFAYQSIWEDNKYNKDDCADVTRDKIVHDSEIEWDKMDKAAAIDHSVSMVNEYIDRGYPELVKQDDIVGIELKRSIILTDKDGNTKPKIMGVADLVITDRVIDFKTSSRKKTKPDGYNYLQNSLYAHTFGVSNTSVHHMSYKKSGAEINEYEVPIMPLSQVYMWVRGFWDKLLTIDKLGLDLKDMKKKFSPTGLVHDWACSYCGYGRSGLCKHKMEV